MRRTSDRRGGDLRYFVRFCVTALILVSSTLVLVLVILPQRYVLSAGFREAGLNYPEAGIPFTPLDRVRIAARPGASRTTTPPPPGAVVRGPAESFWDRVLPLLERERYAEALPIFDAYLADYPTDRDVRRERISTLIGAGRATEAVRPLQALVDETDDPLLRLWLARTLRDLERWDEADDQYAILAAGAPGDTDLALEWARALAWPERYGEAEEVLIGALGFEPESVPLRVELARVYYATGRLEDAAELLGTLTEAELAAGGAVQLRDDVLAALAVPDPVEEEPPTLLEQAIGAREADQFDRAAELFAEALAENPGDADAWLAYANFLEYERSDFAGALAALGEVERLGDRDVELRYRMALLEAWTGSDDLALARLEALLADLEAEPDPEATVTPADVRALMGDLHRWNGDRVAASEEYAAALARDPENARALDGEEAVRIEVAIRIDEVEAPRMGSHVLGLGDTDEFGRFDVGAEWIGVRDGWAWAGTVGRRWLSGLVAPGTPGPPQGLEGTFVDATLARWWRVGTVRTSARLGGQWLRDGQADPVLGLGLQVRPVGGGRLAIDYAHEPAFGLTATLQSAEADVTHDRLAGVADIPLGERWSASVESDVARLVTDGVAGAEPTTRVQGAVTASRAMTRDWSLGWTASALTYSAPAPSVNGLRLFWDPSLALATGPVVRYEAYLSERWEASARLAPGLAFIDERTPAGLEAVPNMAGEVRLEFVGSRLRSAVDLFYGQSRLDGYRTYGARFSVSTASWFSDTPGR